MTSPTRKGATNTTGTTAGVKRKKAAPLASHASKKGKVDAQTQGQKKAATAKTSKPKMVATPKGKAIYTTKKGVKMTGPKAAAARTPTWATAKAAPKATRSATLVGKKTSTPTRKRRRSPAEKYATLPRSPMVMRTRAGRSKAAESANVPEEPVESDSPLAEKKGELIEPSSPISRTVNGKRIGRPPKPKYKPVIAKRPAITRPLPYRTTVNGKRIGRPPSLHPKMIQNKGWKKPGRPRKTVQEE